jgi:hypothetical protein
MDNLENQPPAQPDLNQLREQYESLRGLVVSALVLVIVLGASFDLFLLRQVKFTRAELAAIRPGATQIISDYQAGSARMMDEFVKKITDYGQTHPDFAPILAKYGIRPGAPTGAVSTAVPPVPVKAKK